MKYIIALLVVFAATGQKVDSLKKASASLMPKKLPDPSKTVVQKSPQKKGNPADKKTPEKSVAKSDTKLNTDPKTGTAVKTPLAKADSTKKKINIEHTVVVGENLFQIAKKYGVSVVQIQTANGMKDNNIKLGQKLKISNEVKPKAPVIPVEPPPTPANNPNMIFETGTGNVMSQKRRGSKYFALHREAKIGTKIYVKNLFTGKYIWAKVAGTIADIPENADNIIILSNSAATVFGYKSFPAELAFIPN